MPAAAAEEIRQLLIPTAEVENQRDGVVLLRVGDDEVQKERLAASRGAEDECVPDVRVMQIPVIRRVLGGVKHGQAFAVGEVRAGGMATVDARNRQ